MHHKTIRQLSELLRKKEISSVELTDHFLDRVQRHNKVINAVTHLDEERSKEQAKRVDEKRANKESLSQLAGIPLLHKDIFCTQYEPTTCSSKALKGYISLFQRNNR